MCPLLHPAPATCPAPHADAAPLLRQAHAVLPSDDPSRAEAGFYMDLSALTMVTDVQVRGEV